MTLLKKIPVDDFDNPSFSCTPRRYPHQSSSFLISCRPIMSNHESSYMIINQILTERLFKSQYTRSNHIFNPLNCTYSNIVLLLLIPWTILHYHFVWNRKFGIHFTFSPEIFDSSIDLNVSFRSSVHRIMSVTDFQIDTSWRPLLWTWSDSFHRHLRSC